jgi:hypothetical protein
MGMYTIHVSSDLFLGLELIIYEEEIRDMTRNEQELFITYKAKTKLNSIFRDFNLEILLEKARNLKLHLHGPLNKNEINYVCDVKHLSNA